MAKQKEVDASTGAKKKQRSAKQADSVPTANTKKYTRPTGIKYTPIEIAHLFNEITEAISGKGLSLRKALRITEVSSRTFYEWLNDDAPVMGGENPENNKFTTIGEQRQKQYARACVERADAIFDETIEIADDGSNDTYELETEGGTIITKTDYDVIARSKLRVDTRKWIVAKLNPKKYGDKVETTLVGDEARPVIVSLGSGIKPE